jgi:hypothetical protein
MVVVVVAQVFLVMLEPPRLTEPVRYGTVHAPSPRRYDVASAVPVPRRADGTVPVERVLASKLVRLAPDVPDAMAFAVTVPAPVGPIDPLVRRAAEFVPADMALKALGPDGP